MKYIVFKILILLVLLGTSVSAQNTTKVLPADLEIPLKYGADRLGKRQDAAMRKLRDNRLGLFIHWGLYAITSGEWEGEIYSGPSSFLQKSAKIQPKEWMKLMDKWNPKNFNASEWAKMAKKMGVRYVKITTKHHDGFCLWPSEYSEYTVAHTPSGKDVLGELVKAFNAEDIDVHLYYSILDWSHPDYRYSIKSRGDSVAFSRFLEFAENQVRELAMRYPTVKDFWFDGTWDVSFKENGWWSAHIEKVLKEMIPGITVNSRLRADDYGKRHFDSNGHLMGDYESGYERRLPDPIKDIKVTHHDWEAYMTLPENQWGYHKDWTLSYVKTPFEAIQRIVHATSMGGNMVINFGPRPEGDFRQEELEMADIVGRWMKKYGECVYGCGYAGLAKQDWGYYTRGKDDTVYMIIFNVPLSGRMTVRVPKGVQIEEAVLLHGGGKVDVMEATRNEYSVNMPDKTVGEPFVIKLQMRIGKEDRDKYMDALT